MHMPSVIYQEQLFSTLLAFSCFSLFVGSSDQQNVDK